MFFFFFGCFVVFSPARKPLWLSCTLSNIHQYNEVFSYLLNSYESSFILFYLLELFHTPSLHFNEDTGSSPYLSCLTRIVFTPYFLLKFPSMTPLRPDTQRKVAGWMSQYLTGLANRLMPEYRFFLTLGVMGQKSLTATLLILLPWR